MYDKITEQNIRTQEMYFHEVLKQPKSPKIKGKSFEVIIDFDNETYELSNFKRR